VASPLLQSIRILDLASVGPAARASRMLADYGAAVIKVAPTTRKGAAQIVPPFHTYGAGRGMQRIQIDLKSDDGRAALLRLAEGCDVLIESYRPGVAERLGIGFEALRACNPSIVYCSTSGYGQTGPCAAWAGHDINYLAMAGFLDCCEPRGDGGPPIPGATVADSAGGGMHAAMAILAALTGRAKDRQGAYLDVSATEGVLSLMSLHIDQSLATGSEPGPGHDILTGRYACYDVYRARDGKWLAVGAIEPAFYANLCKALGCDQWLPHQNDDEHQDAIRADFKAAFAKRDRDEWVTLLAPNDTCVTPVYSIAELVADPHFAARGLFVDAEDDEHGKFRQLGPVFAGSPTHEGAYKAVSASQTDTDELLAAAGIGADEIKKMRESGIIA
jgi:alpha-methylacyl-CoA racemase